MKKLLLIIAVIIITLTSCYKTAIAPLYPHVYLSNYYWNGNILNLTLNNDGNGYSYATYLKVEAYDVYGNYYINTFGPSTMAPYTYGYQSVWYPYTIVNFYYKVTY